MPNEQAIQLAANMNLGDLRAFVAVAETGSVNRAAAKLNLTQPAVSRRVQSLEGSLGVALLDRSSKPPRLTPEGRLALDYGRKVLLAVEDLSSHIGSKGVVAGEFRLGVAPGFAEAALGAPLDALIRAFPQLVPRITADWSGNLLTALQENRLDAALVLLAEAQSCRAEGQLRTFRSDRVVVVAARRAPLAASPSILELGQHPWVLNPMGCGFRAALQRALDAAGGHLNVCAEVQSYDLQLSLIARGIGLGLIPMARLKASSLKRELSVLSPRDFRLSVTPALATGARHDRLSSALELLVNKLEALGLRKHASLA
jgi:DNA-binding transcriptional LysR family regulator